MGSFDSVAEARAATDRLAAVGCRRDNILLLCGSGASDGSLGYKAVIASKEGAAEAEGEGAMLAIEIMLTGLGVSIDKAAHLIELLERGQSIVIVEFSDHDEAIHRILHRDDSLGTLPPPGRAP